MTGNSFAMRVAAFYGALFLYIGVYVPFFPVYLKSLGFSPVEIGIVLSLPLAVRVVATPVLTWLADRADNARVVLVAYAFGALVTTSTYLLLGDVTAVAIAVAVNAVFMNPIMPITEALALRGVRLYALDYGRMRLAGSATFIAANVLAGVALAAFGAQAAIWMMAGSALLLVGSGLFLPASGNGGAPNMREGFFQALRAVGTAPFLLVCLGAALLQASHGMFYGFGTVHWAAQGIGAEVAGVLWGIGVVVEIVLFAWSGRVSDALGAHGLFLLALAAAAIRWTGMAFDPPLAALFALQALHGITFGATHLAIMRYFVTRVDEARGSSAQGVFFVIIGVANGLAIALCGPLYEAVAGAGYLAMTIIALTGGAVALAGLRLSR